MEIIWSEKDQTYFTIPDGNIATHKQIHDYYNKKYLYCTDNKIIFEKEENHIPHID